ncbi:carbohydrate kinase family protein [Nocardioides litoris]|uniref:carbohydrate kinase family protein n=1 Tax=Nocardioides litoris TaxID=1926648 RepID=UPI0011245E82|nr:PfkB family carbohydrate kinase [Nocardioides litoris]
MTYALVVGESLVDVVTDASGTTVERPGGSAANVAVALARLGRPVRFATAYADDERGAAIARHLAGAGVEPATDPHVLERTSSAAATIGADGSATYVFDLDWRFGAVETAEPPAYVHVCSIGAVLEPGADDVLALLDRLLAGDAPPTVTYDVNARPQITGTGPGVVGRVESVARRSHVVKASDEDLAVLYPTLGLAEAALHLLGLGPRAVVVTRGGQGALWHDADQVRNVPARPTTVVDTIGAGDTFSAATIDGLWDGLDPEATLARAVRAAAITVSRPGADPPTRAELDAAG